MRAIHYDQSGHSNRIDTSQHRRLKLTIVCLGRVRRHKFGMANFTASFANLGIVCCAALRVRYFSQIDYRRDLNESADFASISGSKASQAGGGLAAQSLMARASRMWIGIRKMENIEAA